MEPRSFICSLKPWIFWQLSKICNASENIGSQPNTRYKWKLHPTKHYIMISNQELGYAFITRNFVKVLTTDKAASWNLQEQLDSEMP